MPRAGTFRGKPLLANHQKSWLWGTIPVWETLHANRWPVYELILSHNANQPIHHKCRELAKKCEIPVREETATRIKQLCGANDHQGILALMGPFPYVRLNQILNATNNSSLIVLLDRLQDPFNMGAIIRSAAAFGVQGVITGTQSQVGITSHVARSSAGTVNQLPICRLDDLHSAIDTLKKNGFQILASTLDAEIPITQVRSAETSHPLAVIIGNEATGVSPELLEQCDIQVTIPMKGTAESLNAAVATGIVLYELTR